MRVRRTVGWVSAAALSAAALPACGGSVAADTVAWEPCTGLAAYVTDLGVDDSVVDRLQCASLEVPLNYADPGGRTVELALSRVQGTDPAAPALFVNPGGPGVEGRSMAATVASDLGRAARWWGSTCAGRATRRQSTAPYPTSRTPATTAASPRTPTPSRPPTATASRPTRVPRFTDYCERRPRRRRGPGCAGPGHGRLSRVSWGTVLGAELQSTFPTHLRRVVLDSMDYTGTSADAALRTLAAADPDVPPEMVPEAVAVDSGGGDQITPDEPDVPPGDAPEPDDNDSPLDPATADFLEHAFDATAGTGYICNSLDPVGDSTVQLAEHRAINAELNRDPQRRIEFPASSDVPGVSLCSGWPLRAVPTAVADTGSDLLIVGHRDENVTPYAWALDAHAAMGGRLLTIEDAAHGSTVGSSCRGLVTEFLDTGRLSRGTCEPH
ncbi:hypothetical protein GS831_16670 [Rhodococcus hoagii]|nr:hypothetical protein [Prescottella equi]